ncbi:hypothetical protein [Hymenobacter sp. HDW8]|uniref:hypothetical protein n=1 Tax=Hymenobacter sp. HDW8 TaxID=2714932 RepID=UPI0014091FDD|nr:hypothetical protein [Hymenobacter sp. HDW8]QIL78360.1 hypothetical protein G7064_21330 [Hymenobacter sp. HDW8]
MQQGYTRACLLAGISLGAILLSYCEPVDHPITLGAAQSLPLAGRWRYDSSRTTLADAAQRVENTFLDPIPPKAVLLIDSAQWRYAGSMREEHVYTRHGDTLLVSRVGDRHLVDQHYIHPDKVGKVIFGPDTLLITTLTPHRLIVEQRSRYSDGSTRTNWLYHSR